MTYLEKFEEIKGRFKNLNKSALKEDFAVQISMTDDDCKGVFYIENKDGNLSIEPYDYLDNTASITCSSQVITDILDGKLNPTKAFETGVLYVTGNPDHALALSKIIKKQRKPAAKKETASKKTK